MGEDPQKTVKIRAYLPDDVKRYLMRCLRNYAELFAWPATDMPNIPTEAACHHLVVNPKAKWVAQHRRVHKLDKARRIHRQ